VAKGILPRVYLGVLGAKWCAPCRELKAALSQIEPSSNRRVIAVQRWAAHPWFYYDIEEHPQLARTHNVKTLPLMIMMVDGHVWEKKTLDELRKDSDEPMSQLLREWFRKARATLKTPSVPQTRPASPVTYEQVHDHVPRVRARPTRG
jgi:thioredoxin-like negative regulator of GroEL